MPKPLTHRELRQLELESPSRAERRAARAIASDADWSAKLTLDAQTRRRHKVSYGEPRIYESIEWLPRSESKRRKVSPHIEPRAESIQTITVGYTLRDPALYFYGHSVLWYYAQYRRGNLTLEEIQGITANVKLMARRGGDIQ